ncbi:uncharacterized protein K452DRAFT_256657, partial [Aplosporella prunicola CBS 121167]
MDSYVYQGLSHPKCIRLIKFLPTTATGGLNVSLHEARFEDGTVQYECLSYVWGLPEPKADLICDGKIMRITKSLDEALYQLQRASWTKYKTSDYFWVDQICINQADNEEKREQVALMGAIYEHAECVWIWLGSEDAASVAVMDFMERAPPASEVETYASNGSWNNTITSILERPWFFRTWIVQEYIMAKRAMMFCGSRSVGSHKLLSMMAACHNERGLQGMSNALNIATLDWRTIPGGEQKAPFIRILHEFRDCEATDKRDKVYGLLGLA